ncbi:hypothetical protein HFP57_08375 [Parasphingopyxis algicola]|uniref:hypothetical protein n=1 Tax=Parasphingopyxis algicola TaxID=2026624 RepID=UPI0015A44E76|nr:hypothetical protein [Parasphingopyxis algicola]QLC25040.1 hypothetical protein HFP57_08375 [Parasphingopyxis algicola]
MEAEQPKQNKWLGRTIQLAAIPAVLIFIGVIAALDDEYDIFFSQAAGVAALLAIVGMGAGIWRYGARHLQPGAEELLAADGRPPILYLRSFAGEKTVGDEELAIARAFEDVGPFVAIVVAGDTPGLGWELGQCAQIDDPRKLVILIPNDERGYDRFREIAKGSGLRLPDYPRKEHRRYATSRLAALLIYDPGWKAKYVRLPKAAVRDINVDGAENRGGRAWAAMQTVARRQGIELPPPPINPVAVYRRIVLYIVVIPGLLFLAIFAAAIGFGYFDPNCTSPEIGDCINWGP